MINALIVNQQRTPGSRPGTIGAPCSVRPVPVAGAHFPRRIRPLGDNHRGFPAAGQKLQ